MSSVSYFQRFSHPENHATNNTMLMLRYIYQSSPLKLQSALTSLVGTGQLVIGPTFEQQVRGGASVPDALIAQQPMRVFVEAKRGGRLDADQIRRHLADIARAAGSRGDILVGLTKESIAEPDRDALRGEASALGVAFEAVTFSQVVEALRAQCADFERELLAIVDDYESYCSAEGLLEERDHRLAVFPCGVSVAENARFGLYYEPVSRPSKRNRFIGAYTRKTVAYVGTVEAVAVTSYQSGAFVEEAGRLTDAHRERIREAIEGTAYYDLTQGSYRFYLVDEFVRTDARKTSPGGIMGMRYLDLSKMVPAYDPRRSYTTEELAAALGGTTWE